MISRLRARILEVTPDLPQGIKGGTDYLIAERTGIHPTILSQYATGAIPIPIPHLYALAKELECQPTDLIGWMTLPT